MSAIFSFCGGLKLPSLFHHRPISALSEKVASENFFCCLNDSRGVVKVKGADIYKFLQGLISNDVMHIANASGDSIMYSLMLNAQGRFAHDMFLHRPQDGDRNTLLLDVGKEGMSGFLRLLQMYKLRSDVEILNVSDTQTVWVGMGSPRLHMPGPWCADPRLSQLGVRAVLPSDFSPPGRAVSPEAFRMLRFQLGVPEGATEILSGEALPLEYNLDQLNGISYQKGCYVGQELTARTHFQGVIRKRLMPLVIGGGGGELVAGDKVTAPGAARPVGKLTAVAGDRGLAVIRLDSALAAIDGQHELHCKGRLIKPSVPEWWPQEWIGGAAAGGEATSPGKDI